METSLIRCVNAWAAVQGLMEQEWDYPSAHALTQLRRALKPHADFFLENELKLADQYGKKGEDGQVQFTPRGTFLFQDPNRAGEYNAKRLELGGVEVDLDWEERTLPCPERVRPVQLEALEGFVRFGGGDEKGTPTGAQRSGSGGERRSPGMSELLPKAEARDMKEATT